MKRLMTFAASAVAAAALGATALAGGAGVEWSQDGSAGTNGSWSMGYLFEAVQDTAVTQLGFFDNFGDGFFDAGHDVGLYDAAGNLLASTTVTSASPLVGHFRWEDITPVALTAGNTYVVAGVSGSDDYAWDTFGFTSDSRIRFVEDRFESSSTLVFPTGSTGRSGSDGNNGFFGGNVWLGEVPAPGALALMGVAGLAARRRRRN